MELEEALRSKSLYRFFRANRQEVIIPSDLDHEIQIPKTSLFLVLIGPNDNLQVYLKNGEKRKRLNEAAPTAKFSVKAETADNLAEIDYGEKRVIMPFCTKADDTLIFSILSGICRLNAFENTELAAKINEDYKTAKGPRNKKSQDALWTIAKHERTIAQAAIHLARTMLPAINPIPNIRNHKQLTQLVNTPGALCASETKSIDPKRVKKEAGVSMFLKEEDVRQFVSSFPKK